GRAPFSSPPPCGEGPGVGVARSRAGVDVRPSPPDPPPYPPPQGGRGKQRAGREKQRAGWMGGGFPNDQPTAWDSPPPCGGGLGVGVARSRAGVDACETPPDPPPHPPPQGGSEKQHARELGCSRAPPTTSFGSRATSNAPSIWRASSTPPTG